MVYVLATPFLFTAFCNNYFLLNIKLILAKKKILCYTIDIERKRENIMKKTNQKTEQVSAPE